MKFIRLLPLLLALSGCAILQPDASTSHGTAHHRFGVTAGITPCNTGTGPNSGNGDQLRTCFTELNGNDAILANEFGVTGIVKGAGPIPAPLVAAGFADVVALWGCTAASNLFMATDGSCQTVSGGGGGGVGATGSPVSGQLAKWSSSSSITNGDLSGDCVTASTLVTTCTKTSGSLFAASATTNALNASNINAGTLNATRLPVTIGSNTSGNAATATTLVATPTQCSGGTPLASGIAANGNANCTAAGSGSGSLNPTGTITNGTAPSWASGTTLASANPLPPIATAVLGYLGLPICGAAAKTANYAPVLGDAGCKLVMNCATACTVTVPANSSVAFGTDVCLVVWSVGAGVVTLAVTTDTMTQTPTNLTGSRTLTTPAAAWDCKWASTQWMTGGSGET